MTNGINFTTYRHDFDKEEQVIRAIKQAAETGDISQDRIDQSVYRILKLKEKYQLSDETTALANLDIINDKIEKLF